jgi:hypothetical protein
MEKQMHYIVVCSSLREKEEEILELQAENAELKITVNAQDKKLVAATTELTTVTTKCAEKEETFQMGQVLAYTSTEGFCVGATYDPVLQ